MKIFSALLCSALLCSALLCSALLCSATTLYGYERIAGVVDDEPVSCSYQGPPVPLESWVKLSTNIFIGTVKQVQTRLEGQRAYSNNCWVEFEIIENLKGEKLPSVWVQEKYDSYSQEDGHRRLGEIKYCTLEEGKTYLVLGLEMHNQEGKVKDYIEVEGGNRAGDCRPVVRLDKGQDMLNRIREIISGGK